MKSIRDLKFHLFSTTEPADKGMLCENSYLFWKRSWIETFNDLDVKKKCHSDEFLNKELGGLFIDNQPVGLILYQFVDLRRQAYQDLTYFENYPHEAKLKQFDRPEKIMIISHMTIAEDWRKSQTDLPVSELLVGCAVLRFLETDAARIITYCRNDRSTNSIIYRHGGHATQAEQSAYNVKVDFAEIERTQCSLSHWKDCAEATYKLWSHYKNTTGENYEHSIASKRNPEGHRGHGSFSVGEDQFLPELARPNTLLHKL